MGNKLKIVGWFKKRCFCRPERPPLDELPTDEVACASTVADGTTKASSDSGAGIVVEIVAQDENSHSIGSISTTVPLNSGSCRPRSEPKPATIGETVNVDRTLPPPTPTHLDHRSQEPFLDLSRLSAPKVGHDNVIQQTSDGNASDHHRPPEPVANGMLLALWDEHGEEVTKVLSSIVGVVGNLAADIPFAKSVLVPVAAGLHALKQHWENVREMDDILVLLLRVLDYLCPYELSPVRTQGRSWFIKFQGELQSYVNRLIEFQDTSGVKKVLNAKKFMETLDKIRNDLDSSIRLVTMAATLSMGEHWMREVEEIKAGEMVSRMISERSTLHQLLPVLDRHWTASSSIEPCLANTRADIIKEILHWAKQDGGRPFLWLTGQMGTGKSSIVKSVCELLNHDSTLGAGYFARRSDTINPSLKDSGHRSRVIPTLVHFLAANDDRLSTAVAEKLRLDPNLPITDLQRQYDHLLWPVLSAFPTTPCIIVIDGLNDLPQDDIGFVGSDLLQLLQARRSVKTKFLICGTETKGIDLMIESLKDSDLCHVINLRDVEKDTFTQDVRRVYIDHFKTLKVDQRSTRSNQWPPEGELQQLIDYTGQLFSFAALAKKYVSHPRYRPAPRLTQLIEGIQKGTDPHLDDLFRLILRDATINAHDPAKPIDENLRHRVRLFLVGLTLAQQLVDLPTLAVLADSDIRYTEIDLTQLSPILSFKKMDDIWLDIKVFHVSFTQYMLSRQRCCDEYLVIVPDIDHLYMAGRCLDFIEKFLVSAMPHASISVSSPLLYACVHVWSHLRLSTYGKWDQWPADLVTKFRNFCAERRFQWLDILGDQGAISRAMEQLSAMMVAMKNPAHPSTKPEQSSLLTQCADLMETREFHEHAISASSRRIYHSIQTLRPVGDVDSAVLTPRVTILYLETLSSRNRRAHEGGILALTGSRHAPGVVASGGVDGQIIVWRGDPSLATTQPLQISHDAQEKLNLVQSRQPLTHKYGLAFTSDGQGLLSAVNGTLRISNWQGRQGTSQIIIEVESSITSIVAASDGDHIVYVTGKNVCLWSISAHKTLWSRDPSSPPPAEVLSIAISIDDKYIATGSTDETIAVINLLDGTVVHRFKEHGDDVLAVAFSLGRPSELASASKDKTVCIWDIQQRKQLRTLSGHTDEVITVAWATHQHHIFSGSKDGTIRMWDASTGEQLFVMSHFSAQIFQLAVLPQDDQVVIGYKDGSISTWKRANHTPTQDIILVAASPSHSAFATFTTSGVVHIINATTGAVVQMIAPVDAHVAPDDLQFSQDGSGIILTYGQAKGSPLSLNDQTLRMLPVSKSKPLDHVKFSLDDDGWLRFKDPKSDVFQDTEMPLCWFPVLRRWRTDSRPLAINETIVAVGGVAGGLTLVDCGKPRYLFK